MKPLNKTDNFREHSQQWQAALALSYKLFVKNWQLENILINIRDYEQNPFLISTIIENNTPIAVATYCKNNFSVNVFVAETHRKKGYGSAILQKLMNEHSIPNNLIYGSLGQEGSDTFYNKNKIVCMPHGGVELTSQESEDFINHKLTYKEILSNKINNEFKKLYNNENHIYNTNDNQTKKLKIK